MGYAGSCLSPQFLARMLLQMGWALTELPVLQGEEGTGESLRGACDSPHRMWDATEEMGSCW